MRRNLLVLLIMGVMLAVTGCETHYLHGPYELGFDGENLLLASCEDRTVSEVRVSEEKPVESDGSDYKVIWEAQGDSQISISKLLTIGVDNPGLEGEVQEKASPSSGVTYRVQFDKTPEIVATATFIIPEEGLEDGSWLDTYGQTRSEPCEGK